MVSVVVGGQARKVGKTSVAAGVIAAFVRVPWTAVKISAHPHDAAVAAEGFAICEETGREGKSDTSRFLAAGARRSLWVRAREESYDAAMRQLLPAVQSDPFVIFESNRILRFIRPDVYILVLRYDVADFKASARETLPLANAIVAVNYHPAPPPWKDISIPEGVPLFTTTDPQIIPQALIDFIQSRLSL